MVQINFAQKQVNAKIVYYGPGMSGKTTNLEIIHQRAPKANRGELTSISTDGDRTLFFDFMPLDLGTVAGMRTCFQIYTVPGQVYYNSTRKLVLQGVDGIIFIADSSTSMLQENIDSMKNLEANLAEYGRSLEELPLVIQYNKRDLPDAMPVEELDAQLNPWHVPAFEGIAHTGQGVFPTLKALAARVIENIHSQQRTAVSPASSGASVAPADRGAEADHVAVAPAAEGAALSQTGFHKEADAQTGARPAAALRTQPTAARATLPAPDGAAARTRPQAPARPRGAPGAPHPEPEGPIPAAQAAEPSGSKLRLAVHTRERGGLPRTASAPAGRPRAGVENPAARKQASPPLKRPDASSMKLAAKRGAPSTPPPPRKQSAPAAQQGPGGAAPLRRTPRPPTVGKKGGRSAILTGIIVVASVGVGAVLGSLVLSIL